MRHGHLWIDWPGPYIDAVAFEGRRYAIEAPMPALLMLPAVMLRGTAVNQTLFAVLLCAVAVGTGWEIQRRLDVPLGMRLWLCGILPLGTGLLWCAIYGDVWFIAHLASAAFT